MKKRSAMLVFTDYFLPGFKAGGPIQSLANFIDVFHSQFEISVCTRDRDLKDTTPYPNIQAERWITESKYRIYYANATRIRTLRLRELIREIQPRVIYWNSLFSPFTRKTAFSWLPTGTACKKVMSVQGELLKPALAIKPLKKILYLSYLNFASKTNGIHFKASSEHEKVSILTCFPGSQVDIASDIPAAVPQVKNKSVEWNETENKCVRFVFTARIAPIKNLLMLLRAFCNVKSRSFHLDIYGSVEDREYWNACQPWIEQLQDRVRVHGAYSPSEIWRIMSNSHYMCLPSLSENFGHSIYEASAAGVPFLIGNNTPWTKLATQEHGYILDPQNESQWTLAIDRAMDASSAHYDSMSQACKALAGRIRDDAIEQNIRFFEEDVGRQN